MNEQTAALTQVFAHVRPEIALLAAACALFLLGTADKPDRRRAGVWAFTGLAVAALLAILWPAPPFPPGTAATAPLADDALAAYSRYLALAVGAVLVLFSWHALPDRGSAEYHACLLLAVAGASLVGAANDLVDLYLALELLSIPTYVMLYLPRSDARAQEAAVKYFLLSVMSSALTLFGFSYLYGLAGTTNLAALADALSAPGRGMPPVGVVAVVMVVAGLAYKMTAVPFHFYAPDVYQGGPTPAVTMLAVLPKLAGFIGLFRVLGFVAATPAAAAYDPQLTLLFWIIAAISMTVGNVMALLQDNLRRILAYSGVAHAGYMLVGLAAAAKAAGAGEPAEVTGVEAVLYYLAAYAAMTLGAFGVVQLLDSRERPVETVDDLAGVGLSHPCVGAAMMVFLLSLIGIPLTAGFVGKLFLFLAATGVPADHRDLFRALLLIGAVNAAIGAYYYLRILGVLYLREGLTPPRPVRFGPGAVGLTVCVAATLVLGVYARPVLLAARAAAVPAPVAAADAPPAGGD